MPKIATCRACGEEFEKPAPASKYCLREACMEARERDAKPEKSTAPKPAKAKPKTPKPTPADVAQDGLRQAYRLTLDEADAAADRFNALCRAANALARVLGEPEPYDVDEAGA